MKIPFVVIVGMDNKSAKELYEDYGFLIYKRCLKLLGNEPEAKDGLQDVMLKLLKQYPKFEDPEHVVPWIYRVVKNYCLNVIKKREKFVDNSVLEVVSSNENTDSELETQDIIRKVLHCHDERVRDSVYYTYIEKLNQEEIRKVTGMSPATIRRNLKKFKDSLPAILKRLGLQ